MSKSLMPLDIALLPPPAAVWCHCVSSAMLSALVDPDRDWRLFTVVSEWRPGIGLARIDNRQGDCLAVAIGEGGAVMVAYSKASPLSTYPAMHFRRAEVSDAVGFPRQVAFALDEQEFDLGGRTFCAWHNDRAEARWVVPVQLRENLELLSFPIPYLGVMALGLPAMLSVLDEDYQRIDLASVADMLFRLEPLSADVIVRVAGHDRFAEVVSDARLIGYPVA